MSHQISHNRSRHRFETEVDEKMCVLDYQLGPQQMTITHTEVPASVGGRGIASALTEQAMLTARAEGWKVMPACSYAAGWLGRHPEYADLLA